MPQNETYPRPFGHVLEWPCPDCGGQMVLRDGRYGPFYGCRRYPDCTATCPADVRGIPRHRPSDAVHRALRAELRNLVQTIMQNTGMQYWTFGRQAWELGIITSGENVLGLDDDRLQTVVTAIRAAWPLSIAASQERWLDDGMPVAEEEEMKGDA